MRLSLKVSPKSSRNAIQGWMGDTLKVQVTAAPERGKANEAVQELLAEALKLPKSAVQVVAGHGQPRKVVEIAGLEAGQVHARLSGR